MKFWTIYLYHYSSIYVDAKKTKKRLNNTKMITFSMLITKIFFRIIANGINSEKKTMMGQ